MFVWRGNALPERIRISGKGRTILQQRRSVFVRGRMTLGERATRLVEDGSLLPQRGMLFFRGECLSEVRQTRVSPAAIFRVARATHQPSSLQP